MLATLAVLGLAAALPRAAQAQSTSAATYSGGGTQANFARATGYSFTPTVDLTVTDLGVLDLAGLSQSHDVGIFVAATSAQVLFSTVPGGAAATLIGGSRFVPVSPTLLSAGTKYYILGSNWTVDRYVYGTGVAFAPSVNWNGFTDGDTNDVHSAPTFNSGLPGDFGPNFRFRDAASAVPEPSGVAAFAFTGLGAAGLILTARKRRSAA